MILSNKLISDLETSSSYITRDIDSNNIILNSVYVTDNLITNIGKI